MSAKPNPWFDKLLTDADEAALESDAVDIMHEFYLEKLVRSTQADEQRLQTIFEKKFGLDGWDRVKTKGRALATSQFKRSFQ
jgi:hypothetical protein